MVGVSRFPQNSPIRSTRSRRSKRTWEELGGCRRVNGPEGRAEVPPAPIFRRTCAMREESVPTGPVQRPR